MFWHEAFRLMPYNDSTLETNSHLLQRVRSRLGALCVLRAARAGNADRAYDLSVHNQREATLDRGYAFQT